MANQYLVIVESPAKAKTIGKYLGDGYKVKASMGHLRDLPKSVMGVDLEHDFTPDYQPVKGREETIAELRAAAKKADKVFLATDPDREGEAISWHLKELLGIPDDQVYRVTFNEITRKVVTESIQKPREIDQNLVDAQQARRILDRIVGYKLSPLLWRKIKRGLSAGRVQSVATRMVVDREEEIRAFVPEEYWILDAVLNEAPGNAPDDQPGFLARYVGPGGKKRELHSEQEVNEVVDAVRNAPFLVTSVKKADKSKNPPPPFTTSTLQQDASRKLSMTPRRTMSVAQQLYEGVELGEEGSVGLITYMRTDSLRISEEAQSQAKEFILQRYGAAYHPGTARQFKAKGSVQDAHEAIRPTNVLRTPEEVRGKISPDQYRLYRLIWGRFVASQMSAAVYSSVTVDTESAGYVFRSTRSSLKFAGYTAVYEEGRDDESEEKQEFLPTVFEGDLLILQDIKKEQKFTQPPSRYTEATLIKAMEETGVGRPSTYAPTVSTILDREYVVKEGRYLRPTPLGSVVTGLMKERFADIVDLKFTARMETELDSVESGEKKWKEVLADFYGPFEQSLESAEKALEGERIRIPDEETDEVCDLCGRKMVIKSGRFGRFLACPGYPECSFTKPLVIEMPGKCPKCGSRILKRTSKNGYTYYACEKGAACGFMTWDVPTKDNCPECGMTMFKKSGRGFNKPFCVNETCAKFVPEDKRGYKKKTPAAADGEKPAGDQPAEPEQKEKKPAAKKAAAKKTATAAKKTTAKKTTAKKTAAKKPAAKKTAAKKADAKTADAKKATTKKTTAKKPAARKTAAKKAEE